MQGSLSAEVEVTEESESSGKEYSDAEPILASPTLSCLNEADGALDEAPKQLCQSPVLEVCSMLSMRSVAA